MIINGGLFDTYEDKTKTNEFDWKLHYGQGIIIKGYKAEKHPDEGFMTVRDFADTSANYETTSDILFSRTIVMGFLSSDQQEILKSMMNLKRSKAKLLIQNKNKIRVKGS